VLLTPHMPGLFFGKYVLKLDPVMLFGVNTGSLMTYAVGNILLVL